MIQVWRGFHSPELLERLRSVWGSDDLLIVCPPGIPDSEIDFALLSRTQFPEAPVLGVFTSGTVSGKPRLVLYSKSCLRASLRAIRSLYDTDRIRTIFCYPQPFHTFGLVLGYVHAVEYGLNLVPLEGRYSSEFHGERLAIDDPDLLTLGTPSHFHDLLARVRKDGTPPAPSYSSISGGAKTSRELWRAIRGELRVEAPSIGYGATEASPGVTHLPPGQMPCEDGAIGRPLPGVEVVLRPEGLEFSGPATCLAIVERGEIRFPRRVLLRDSVRRRDDGELVFAGRTDWMLNRGGEKFSLETIEQSLRENLREEAICVAVPDPRLGEELGILLAAREGGEALEVRSAAIAELLEREFGQRFGSRRIVVTERLPLNEAGKADRRFAAERVIKRG